MTHTCPYPDCPKPVADEMFACRSHWFTLPKPIRNDIWTAYKNEGIGSASLRRAHEAAIEWWDEQPGPSG